MRILHTSDWHLGIQLHGLSLLDSQRRFVDNFLEIIEQYDVELVIIAGDIFDSAVSSREAIALYDSAMTRICLERGIPAVVIAGNHDGAERLSSCSALMQKAGLFVIGKISQGIGRLEFGDVHIYPLPYFHIDEVRALYPQKKIRTYSEAIQLLCGEMELDENAYNIAVAHVFAAGSELSDSDRSAAVGTITSVDPSVFAGFDYTALGHLHRAQEPLKNVRYSGTPLKYSFSEAEHKKSLTLIDTNTGEITELAVRQPRELRIIRAGYDEALELAGKLRGCSDYVRIEFSDIFPSMQTLYTFREYFPELLSVTGIMPEEDGGERYSLSIDDVESFSPQELVEKFYSDITGEMPDKTQIEQFLQAMEEALSDCGKM